jgi:multiple sugar transport system ATP-binding protein
VAEFVGSPGMNFLDGEIDVAHRSFQSQQISIALKGSHLEAFGDGDANKRITLGIRPEDIHVSLSQRDDWHQANVYVTELMGSETFVILQLSEAKLTARAAGDFRAEPDSPLWIDFDTTKAHFFDPETGRRL